MPKLTPPVDGHNVKDFLEYLDGTRDSDFLKKLISRVNHSTCCNVFQTIQLKEVADRQHPEENEFQRAFNEALLLANSFNQQCHECLNRDCIYRDPEHPITEVLERAKLFKDLTTIKDNRLTPEMIEKLKKKGVKRLIDLRAYTYDAIDRMHFLSERERHFLFVIIHELGI